MNIKSNLGGKLALVKMIRFLSINVNMILRLLLLFSVVGFTSTAHSCPECCNRYVIVTEQSSNQTVEDSCTCRLTLGEFILQKSNETISQNGNRCSSEELILESGIHFVHSDTSIHLLPIQFRNLSSVVIRGHTGATIECLNQSLFLRFTNVSIIKIQDIHIDKCTSSDDNGLNVDIESVKVDISNSKFTDSGITFHINSDVKELDSVITIKDTVFVNCFSELLSVAVLQLVNDDWHLLLGLNVTLTNVNASHNNREFLKIEGYYKSHITLTGCNYFAQNDHTVLAILGYMNKLTFWRTKTYFINNNVQGNYFGLDSPIYIDYNTTLLFHNSHVLFTQNHGGIKAIESNISFTHNTKIQFINNNSPEADKPPILADGGTISFEHSSALFNNNQGGGIEAFSTNIIFRNNVTIQFNNNFGRQHGGALALHFSSSMIFNASSLKITLNFTNNTAEKGGAIYVRNTPMKSLFNFQCDPTLVEMTFSNNSALYGGNHIYGGWVDWTIDSESGKIRYNSAINKSLNILTNRDSDISSCPVRICLCKDGHPDCNITNYSIEVYGFVVSLNLAAIDQRYNPVAAHVKASLKSDTADSDEEQWQHLWPRTENLLATCTRVTYKFSSIERTIHFEPEIGYCYGYHESWHKFTPLQHSNLFQNFSIKVKSKQCPLGFILHRIMRTCICDQPFRLTCDEANTKIIRKEQEWIGVTNKHTKPGVAIGVLTHSPCPFDYCRTDNHSLSIHLEDQDVVCAFNRSGILCGGCRANFSRVLGSSKCKECSNNIPVIIVIFLGQVLFGLIVVIALILLDLTVATGTINGLTFYANIIQAQHATFFTQDTAHSFLSFFIARLNLDEGIKLCLYDGLDEYAITWLKIPLPLYMWLFAGILIVLSRRFSRFTRLLGKNIVQVLATLFLISYTRLLQLIIDVFSYTSLTYPDGYRKKVWYVDGNVEYFKGKHIPLFFVTVLFLSVSLPYTVILLTIQLLYKISRYRLMFWVQRLKPFFDAYTGPYKAPHRYWTGLLLVVRIILLTIFSTFQSNHLPVNPLSIIIISIALIGWLSLAKGVYESSLNNFLELMFLSNLAITSAVVLVDRQHTKVAIYISTGTAFITFVCIILYHVVKQLLLTRLGSKIKGRIQSIPSLIKSKVGDTASNNLALGGSHGKTHTAVTSTTVELKAPLLAEENY